MEHTEVKSFEIIAGDDILIHSVIAYYNKNYHTDFEVSDFDDRDGVLFATIKFTNGGLKEVFQFGVEFGMTIQLKRHKKEIDW